MLLRREDEARSLRLEVAELSRGIHAARRILPRIPALDGDIMLLHKELLETRRTAAELSLALESPGNSGRYACCC